MSRLCNSKSQKIGLMDNFENKNPPFKCVFNVEFPPILSPEDLYPEIKQDRTKSNCNQNATSKGKLRFQCHYEDRKRRAEFRRRKIIQKLKKNYAIDVDGLNENTTREIIMKAEMMEKEKHQREKRNAQRMVTMITRLIQEQKYKFRGNKVFHPPWRKTGKSLPASKSVREISDLTESIVQDEEEKSTVFFGEVEWNAMGDKAARKSAEFKPLENEGFTTEEETKALPKCIERKKSQGPSQVFSYPKLVRKPKTSCVSVESCLESSPKRVVFNGYEKGKVYLQDLKITNIGVETIHCRYLGIVVHTKVEKRFPIGVAVRDNVKLRPGLCCSTKIRLCSQEDTKELQCSVVYETRRQRNPLQHSWFFVQVVCIPVRAEVKVFPLKITFPSLTWCEAKGKEGVKLLRKTIKIENSGGKGCWCRISNTTLEPEKPETPPEFPGEVEEAEGEAESVKTKSQKSESNNSRNKSSVYSGEFDGEGYQTFSNDAENIARLLVDEIFENIFSPFQFSKKYGIEVLPFSTVQIEVRFVPQYKGFHHELNFVQFEECENCREQAIELLGDIKQIPLKVVPQVIDLKTCTANSGVYAGTFKIFNESKGPYSVALKLPPSIKNHAHVYPRATTIPPLNSSNFSVRIYPRVTLARDAPRYYNENSQVLEFPVFIHPANVGSCKKDFKKIYVFALITDYCLELCPSSINFGTVTTLETVRTELELTNHSLAIQEYGFLNLPKGVRVEPNMGFGKILPKETITLYLLYSPDEDLIACDDTHEFQVAVTSIAKYGGFKEKLEPPEESSKYSDLIWGEDNEIPTFDAKSNSDDQQQYMEPEDSEDYDACEDESSIEGEELCSKIYQHENKIRKFLHFDDQKPSEHSYLKRMKQSPITENLKDKEVDNPQEHYSEYGEFDGYKEFGGICEGKPDLHIVNCRAILVEPRCRFSETVIRLPATSCSSFSLYRFRLECIKQQGDINCSCGFKRVSKCLEKQKYQCSFEFQYACPNIKLEPESGYIKPGENLPITIIHRPEFPAEQLQYETRQNKMQKSLTDATVEKEKVRSTSSLKLSKGKQNSPKNKIRESGSKNTVENVINVASMELENSDLFAAEKSLAKLISPFNVTTKLQCIIKSKSCDGKSEKTEIHEIVVICPAVKPNFIYLGNSQEIKFGKVFVGTRSKKIIQIQNISLERSFASATLLNPVGPFFCPAGIRQVEVDPEHIWQQPLLYAPLQEKGIEKQFFEIYCQPTNIFLAVSGEAVEPEYKMIPNFACCQIEAKLGNVEELKLEIENVSTITMNVYLVADFVKEGPDLEDQLEKKESVEEERVKENKKEKPVQKDDAKDKKKSKNSGNENFQFWDEIPEIITSALENFVDVAEEDAKAFTLLGVNDNNEIVIPPSGRQQMRIQFKAPDGKDDKKHAVKYSLKLERVYTLKEILLLGKIFRENDKNGKPK